jgi:hypothetical protein
VEVKICYEERGRVGWGQVRAVWSRRSFRRCFEGCGRGDSERVVAWDELDNVSCSKWLSEVESCVWQSWLSIGGSLRGCMVPGRTFEMSLWR